MVYLFNFLAFIRSNILQYKYCTIQKYIFAGCLMFKDRIIRNSGFFTDKKDNQIFLIYKEIQNGAVAKSYMTNGLLIYG
jgi:hypothetical protein